MKIALIGSGNVATHLAAALWSAGHEIAGIYSRNLRHASELAYAVGSRAFEKPVDVASSGADCMLVSIADSAVVPLLETFPAMPDSMVALHTSGTLPMDVLLPVCANVGILYPLQTFSKDVPVNVRDVPFFIEGNSEEAIATSRILAESVSDVVNYADAAHRKVLHIAGVLSCNFPNFLWECCENLLASAGYPLSVVEPLVRATVDKAFSIGPHSAQTGPARRGDNAVVSAHAEFLDPPLDTVYRLLSDMIKKAHNPAEK